MKTYEVLIRIRAECEADAKELLDYTAQETSLDILNIKCIERH
jgi:hypothetical protein